MGSKGISVLQVPRPSTFAGVVDRLLPAAQVHRRADGEPAPGRAFMAGSGGEVTALDGDGTIEGVDELHIVYTRSCRC